MTNLKKYRVKLFKFAIVLAKSKRGAVSKVLKEEDKLETYIDYVEKL